MATNQLLGPQALNKKKDALEGNFAEEQRVWGLLYNTKKQTVTVPDKKLEKGVHLLALPCFQHGCKARP